LVAMAEMIGLGVPAGRQVGGERGMDEPGDGRGMRAAGIALQGEWDELRWLDRPDYGRGVRLGRGRNEQDPADVALLLAAAIPHPDRTRRHWGLPRTGVRRSRLFGRAEQCLRELPLFSWPGSCESGTAAKVTSQLRKAYLP